MQYQSECLSALKSVANIQKPFEKTFMDTMKLFMAIPDRINFLQLGRYGCFSEQTYRNLFENETFDWFAFNASIISKHLTGKRKAIAIDPSYIPKSGHKTPWIGYFWSGCAGDYKRGLEIMGIGVIDIDNHECMTLGSIQTPDCKTLDNMGKNLVDWYSSYLISRKDKLQGISRTVVADAFFSKETFITPMCEGDFHVISRFRNDVVLYYPTLEKKTRKRGHPKWFDGRIDFANLDLTRCKEYEVNKGKLYGVGVGPGDPELLTAKAIRILGECDVIAVPQSENGGRTALEIASCYIKDKPVRAFDMPMTHDRAARNASHDAAADAICALLDEGKNVAFLTLGDPTVYSTGWYVHKRVVSRGYDAELIPGVPSFCAAAARLGRALCEDGEMLHIIPASHGKEREGLALPGSKVLMKAGRGVLRVREELRESGQLENAALVERCGMEGERLVYDMDELREPSGYFSIILVKEERR